jgi:hypothetical protein
MLKLVSLLHPWLSDIPSSWIPHHLNHTHTYLYIYDLFWTASVVLSFSNTVFWKLDLFISSLVKWSGVALSNGASWLGTFPLLCLMTETDPFSEELCLKKLKIMDNVQNNSDVYCNTPSSETHKLILFDLPVFYLYELFSVPFIYLHCVYDQVAIIQLMCQKIHICYSAYSLLKFKGLFPLLSCPILSHYCV